MSIPHIDTTRGYTATIQKFYRETAPFIRPNITSQSLSESKFPKRPVRNIWVTLMSTIQFNGPKHLLNSEVFPCNLLHKERLMVRGLCGYEHAGFPTKAITKPSAHVPITIQYFLIINGCRLISNRY